MKAAMYTVCVPRRYKNLADKLVVALVVVLTIAVMRALDTNTAAKSEHELLCELALYAFLGLCVHDLLVQEVVRFVEV